MTNGGTVSCYAGSDGDFVQMFENGTNSNYHEAGHQFSGKLLFWPRTSGSSDHVFVFLSFIIKTEQSKFAYI